MSGRERDWGGNELEKIQNQSLDILLGIAKLCEKHGIRFFLDSGTLLGARRHGGFIPWDDDVDIAMQRADFERFRKIAEKELPENLRLLLPGDFRNGEAFYDFVPRVVDTNTSRSENKEEAEYYENKLAHLWVDIFILDHLPDSGIAAFFVRLMQKALYGMAMSGRYRIDFHKYTFFEGLAVRFLENIGKHIGLKNIFGLEEKLSVRYDRCETKRLYYSNYQPDFIDVTVLKAWFEGDTKLSFEGHELSVPSGYDEVLTQIYGDFMTPPPAAERKPSHRDELL